MGDRGAKQRYRKLLGTKKHGVGLSFRPGKGKEISASGGRKFHRCKETSLSSVGSSNLNLVREVSPFPCPLTNPTAGRPNTIWPRICELEWPIVTWSRRMRVKFSIKLKEGKKERRGGERA